MLNGTIKIAHIDYGESIDGLLKRHLPRLEEKRGDHPAVRLLEKLGDNAPSVLAGMLAYMPDCGREKLICELAEQYHEPLLQALNRGLASSDLGRNVTLGNIWFRESEEGIEICLEDVRIDYKGLLGSETVQKKVEDKVEDYMTQSPLGRMPGLTGLLKDNAGVMAKIAASFVPEDTENGAFAVLENPKIREILAELLEKVLKKEGFSLEIGQIDIYPSDSCEAEKNRRRERLEEESGTEREGERKKKFFGLSEETSEMVLDGIADFLTEKTSL